MRTMSLVQPRLALLAIFALGTAALAEATPSALDVLASVRVAQSAENRQLTGHVRTGPKKVPFRLSMKDGEIRWQFQDPTQTIALRLGDDSSSLEEITADGTKKVAATKFDDSIRESDITYEDLALRFLYWKNATVEGEQTILLTKCWQVLVRPPSSNASSYSQVRLWIAKESGALMKAEAFGRDGKLARTFRVVSGQKLKDGLWILKSMRIESATPRAGGDKTPSYLEINSPE